MAYRTPTGNVEEKRARASSKITPNPPETIEEEDLCSSNHFILDRIAEKESTENLHRSGSEHEEVEDADIRQVGDDDNGDDDDDADIRQDFIKAHAELSFRSFAFIMPIHRWIKPCMFTYAVLLAPQPPESSRFSVFQIYLHIIVLARPSMQCSLGRGLGWLRTPRFCSLSCTGDPLIVIVANSSVAISSIPDTGQPGTHVPSAPTDGQMTFQARWWCWFFGSHIYAGLGCDVENKTTMLGFLPSPNAVDPSCWHWMNEKDTKFEVKQEVGTAKRYQYILKGRV